MEYIEWFLTSAGMVGGSIVLAQLANSKLFPNANDLVKWLTSFVSSEILTFFGWKVVAGFLKFGIFVNTETTVWDWQSVAAVGVGITLVANRVFTLEDVRVWLKRLFNKDLPAVK
jgi:hypothetical protein